MIKEVITMRKFNIPEMNIAMFESENVVVTDSTLKQANDFLTNGSDSAATTHGTIIDNAKVATANILDFR